MELPEGWSLKKSRLGQKAFIHAETNTKIFEVPDENTIFELAKARPKKYKAFLERIGAQKGPENDVTPEMAFTHLAENDNAGKPMAKGILRENQLQR